MPIGRNSFIQMTKLSNVKGRITYISSHAKQENLYAVYETTERKFWRELAKCNQEEFVKSFTEYQPDRLLQLFTSHFKQNYGTECIAALHHNKRKTNYHIHLIFAERKLLDEPIIKIASRNMFYDENGKHVRTKKEILGEDGEIREGCSIVKKGEVYEKKLFTAKDERFKSNSFLDEVKHSYTDLINIYLATKKIGKNNPKAQEIEADNQKRREWNRAVDMALISGVPEPKIMEVKRKEITESIRESIARRGNRPRLFSRVVTVAVEALEFLIASVLFKKPREVPKQTEQTETEHPKHVAENSTAAVKTTKEEKAEPEQPKMTRLASKYPKLFKVNKELEDQNGAIQQKQKQLSAKKKELSEVTGWFKGRKKKELQKEIDELKSQIRDMKDYLPRLVQKIGYRSVQEFLKDFKDSQTEYSQYRTAIEKWKKETGKEPVAHGIRAKLAEKKQEIQNEQKNKQHTRSQNKDRGAR